MGCASSRFLKDDDGGVIVHANIGHHIVSLTSTTYGLLTTLDQSSSPKDLTISSVFSPSRSLHPPPPLPPHPPPPPLPPPPPPPPSASSRFHFRSATEPDISNSPDIMAIFHPGKTHLLSIKDPVPRNKRQSPNGKALLSLSPKKGGVSSNRSLLSTFTSVECTQERKFRTYALEMFPRKCPSGGENAAILYTTSLRGIRKTYEDCNQVRSALQGLGVWFKERDISMDMGFREELKGLVKSLTLPKLFVRGRCIGGNEEVLRIHEEGGLEKLLEGLPKAKPGQVCDGCCGDRFLPCFCCNGGKKIIAPMGKGEEMKGGGGVVRCPECNENGLVPCPICC